MICKGVGDLPNNQRKSSASVLGKQVEKSGITKEGKNLKERKWSNSLGCCRVVKTDSNRKVDIRFAFSGVRERLQWVKEKGRNRNRLGVDFFKAKFRKDKR